MDSIPTTVELHRQNVERLQIIEKEQRAQLGTLARIDENTKGTREHLTVLFSRLENLEKRVDNLESDKDKAKGAIWVLGGVGAFFGALMGAAVDALARTFFK